MKNRRFGLALWLLGIVHGAVLLAGFVAPYNPEEQDRQAPYAPPSSVHFFDRQGRFHARPFVYAGDVASPVQFFVRGPHYNLLGLFPARRHLFGVQPPGRLFLLGTDGYGRDQFSRLLHGGRISLGAGLLATALSLGLGVCLGAAAGFYGGWLDEALMRGAELSLALPWLYLLLGIRALLPLDIPPRQAFLLVAAIIGVVGWARPARLVRGIALSARQKEYVLAARGFGASDLYLLRRHVLPQTYGAVRTQATLLIPQYVLAEVTLSFLGLGVGEPVPSWGNMLAVLRQYYVLVSYWWMLLPALMLVPLFFGYYRLAGEVPVAGSNADRTE